MGAPLPGHGRFLRAVESQISGSHDLAQIPRHLAPMFWPAYSFPKSDFSNFQNPYAHATCVPNLHPGSCVRVNVLSIQDSRAQNYCQRPTALAFHLITITPGKSIGVGPRLQLKVVACFAHGSENSSGRGVPPVFRTLPSIRTP